MSVLMSPSDNTGWGAIGTALMRATGLKFTKNQPVRVRPYYRAQWGQLNARTSLARLKQRLKIYEKKHRNRSKRRAQLRRSETISRKKKRENATKRFERYLDEISRIRAFNRARREVV
ncbi:pVII [Odocoileus adenovirus 1]|uniref:PVII n=2 Tax=Deer atadenovirus A TaxID=2169706 RepID=A0A515MFR7_9ADEN|nr:pVII [Odocoileus adenovirus 1]QDM55321.1 pVII [Deer atadenovirus A]ASU50502.1 pVII [Odocoileus adenovirus 1]ASU50529.1 pVII [Odocoileus adenovirus 1]ASU50556.1 pVII [Odocoileus adenovirus 1]